MIKYCPVAYLSVDRLNRLVDGKLKVADDSNIHLLSGENITEQ